MAEMKKRWYVLRAIGGKEKKVKEYIENETVLTLIVTDIWLNIDVTVSSFEVTGYGAFGNLKYSITFEQKKPLEIYTTDELNTDSYAKKTVPRIDLAAATTGSGQNYTIVNGDSLWKIAQKQYGDGSQWKKIYDANKDAIESAAKKYGKKVYAAVSNMSIAMERRDFLQQIDCFVCNQQEAGLLFSDDYDHLEPEEMCRVLAGNVHSANIPCMVVTMGGKGAVFARSNGECGIMPAKKVDVIATTGAGDAFFAGITMGLTYGKTMDEACEIGTRLSASVICTSENVCPRFLPSEFGLEPGRAAGEQLTFDI